MKIRTGALAATGADRWYVTDGLNAVGPVRLELLTRGIESGKVPVDTFVRHEGWKVWRPVTDFAEIVDDLAPSNDASAASPLSALFAVEHTSEPISDSELLDAESQITDVPRTATPATASPLTSPTSDGAPTEHPATLQADTTAAPTAAPSTAGPSEGDRPTLDMSQVTASPLMGISPLSTTSDALPLAPAAGPAQDGPTELSRDLLGADRPTLASYLDDDEETQVPAKRRTSPPQVEVLGAQSQPQAVPQPGASRVDLRAPAAPSSPAVRAPSAIPSPPAAPPGGTRPPLPPPRGAAPSVPVPPPRTPLPPPRSPSMPPLPPPRSPSIPAAPPVPPRPGSLPPRSAIPQRPGSIPPRPAVRPFDDALSSIPGWPVAPEPERSAARSAVPSEPMVASDLSEALLVLLGNAVKQTHAEGAVLHRMADDGATVVCAHGPNMVEVLGSRTRLLDPAVVAAAGGHLVIAEPAPGPAGEATLNRMRKLGVDAEGAVMLPLRPRGRLLGLLELGKKQRFSLREIAVAEELAAAFVARAEASGWSA